MGEYWLVTYYWHRKLKCSPKIRYQILLNNQNPIDWIISTMDRYSDEVYSLDNFWEITKEQYEQLEGRIG